ncbi:MAG: ferritin [Thermoplasmata archaeon]
MIKESIVEAINKQINAEMYSGYLYLSMAVDFGEKNLDGFEHWMRLQAQEELDHGMRFMDYLQERGGHVELETIEKPEVEWKTPLEAFEYVYRHECKVTGMINDLVDLAEKEKDRATVNMLQWFVDEQVEEEDSADEIVQKLKMVGDSPSALLMMNERMAERPVESGESEE